MSKDSHGFQFEHVMVLDVTYSTLGLTIRSEWHRKVALHYEAQPQSYERLNLLGHHWRGARDLHKATHYYDLATRHAFEQFHYAEAEQLKVLCALNPDEPTDDNKLRRASWHSMLGDIKRRKNSPDFVSEYCHAIRILDKIDLMDTVHLAACIPDLKRRWLCILLDPARFHATGASNIDEYCVLRHCYERMLFTFPRVPEQASVVALRLWELSVLTGDADHLMLCCAFLFVGHTMLPAKDFGPLWHEKTLFKFVHWALSVTPDGVSGVKGGVAGALIMCQSKCYVRALLMFDSREDALRNKLECNPI